MSFLHRALTCYGVERVVCEVGNKGSEAPVVGTVLTELKGTKKNIKTLTHAHRQVNKNKINQKNTASCAQDVMKKR